MNEIKPEFMIFIILEIRCMSFSPYHNINIKNYFINKKIHIINKYISQPV